MNISRLTRREWLGLGLGLPLAGCSSHVDRIERGPLAIVLDSPPSAETGAAWGSAYARLLAALSPAGRPQPIRLVPHVALPGADPRALLRKLAASDVRMVVCVGERFDAALKDVARERAGQRFTTLGGAISAPGVACYRPREAETAWLAGYLATRLTGGRPVAFQMPREGAGLRAETAEGSERPVAARRLAAFSSGARRADSAVDIRVMDADLSPAALVSRLEQDGVSCVHASLDSRSAPVAAAFAARPLRLIAHECGEGMVTQTRPIGPAETTLTAPRGAPGGSDPIIATMTPNPPWLVGRACTDPSVLLERLLADIFDGVWRAGLERSFGLRQPALLRLEVAQAIDAALLAELETAAFDIRAGRIRVEGNR